jgi:anti-sigma regulatory factor (Ser/Thr protein kinase)
VHANGSGGQNRVVTEDSSGATAGVAFGDEIHVALGTDLQAPRRARDVVREALAEWQLSAILESVLLAVSELVTNALIHGSPPVDMTLRRSRGELRVGVHDNNPELPQRLSPVAHEATSGRGLDIVASLADDLGCEGVPNDGKIVYASFATPTGPTSGVQEAS